MAIIYSYPTVIPTTTDLILGTDVSTTNKSTKNFTVQSIIDLVAVATGNLQTVLDLGNSATGGNANITLGTLVAPTGTVSASIFTTGTMTINGGIGTGFTDLTSTRITGIIQDASSIQGAVTGVTQTAGTNNLTLATTAYVDSIVDPSVLQYRGDTTGPFDLNLVADDLRVSGTTGEIEVTAVAVNAGNIGTIVLGFPAAGIDLPDGSDATTQPATNSTTLIATTAFVQQENNSQDLDFSGDSGTGSVILSGAGAQAFAITGTTGQVVTAAANQGLVLSLPATVVRNLEGNVTGILKDGSSIETTVTGITQTQGNDSTRLATTKYVDAATGAKTLSYKDTSATVKTMNLTADDLQFTGGSNITSTALAVATNIADIKFGLDNSIVLSGQVKADNFTTTLGAATWATTILAGFTSITSTSFVGALTGNATTATSLAAPGTIQLTAGSGLTQGVASNAITYTSGGNVSLTTSLANTTVTAKTLLNLPGFTSASITAGDTILAALAKLQGQITSIPQGLVYKGLWNASTNSPTLASGVGVTGQFYIVSVAGATNLDGITDWQVGDWAIFVEVGATDTWQKLDNSQSITGSGAANKITKWTSPTVLGTGLIEDDGTTVTIGANGNLTVLGDTILGDDAAADTITLNGPATFQSTGIFKVGIGLGGAVYGSAGQVLTSGGGSGNVNTWTSPTVGTLTSVGLTETGNALTITNSPITTSGDINIAGAGNNTQYINGALDLVAFPPVDNYNYWALVGDTGAAQLISSTDTATFAGGFGISTVTSAADTLTTAIDIIGTDNAIAGLTAATPLATDTLWFNDISDSNTIRKATISDIVDLGNETLAQVLSNGNVTGSNNIVTSQNITFQDSSAAGNGRAVFGAGSDLSIYHDPNSSGQAINFIDSTNDLGIKIRSLASNQGHVQIQASNAAGNGVVDYIDCDGGVGEVTLYHYGQPKLSTKATGVDIFGVATIATSEFNSIIVDSANSPSLLLHNANNSYYWRSCAEGNGLLNFDLSTSSPTANYSTKMSLFSTFASFSVPEVYLGLNNQGFTEVRGDLKVLGNIIHGTGGGVFNGDQAIVTANPVLAFTLNRATTGTLMFDVWLTSETSTATSVAKKYTVAHSNNATPVYNKIIDTGLDGSNDFLVTFLNAGSGLSVTCNIQAVGVAQNIGYTVQVGHDSTNALTFTAAS